MSGLQDTAASPALGQKTMAESAPVVIASDQSPIPVTGTVTATNPSVGINGDPEPGSSTQVGGTDGTDLHPAHVYPAGGVGEYAIGVELRNTAGEVGTALNPIVVTGTVAAANPSVGLNGVAAPASSTQAGGVDSSGDLRPLHLYDLDGTPTSEFVQGVVLRASNPGGGSFEAGTAANPLRIDPTGTTPQPIVSPFIDAPLSGLATEATLASIDGKVATAAHQIDGLQRTQITDLGGVTNATVKPAGTPAVAADTALVVAISPNNPIVLSPGGDTVGATVALGALGAMASVVLAGQNSVGVFIKAGSLVGTVIPEVSYNGGATWVATEFFGPSNNVRTPSLVFAVANPDTSISIAVSGGQSHARVRVSAWTIGTADATLRATAIEDTDSAPTAPPIGSGRIAKVLQNTVITGILAETLIPLVMLSNGTPGALTTSYMVTAGKTLRLTGFIVSWRSAGAPANGVTVRVRTTTAGPVAVGSPCIATLFAGVLLAGIGVGNGGSASFVFSEGYELQSPHEVGITQQATAALTVGFDVQLIGYEY